MPDGDYKFSSWTGTNGVLASSGQEPQTSSAPKTNYAGAGDNSSWDENVQKNPFKYSSSYANSKIYLTNDYNQYLTKQWSQKQAAMRYNIQTPKTHNPRYNMPPAQALMSESEFKEQYKSTFESILEVFDTASGIFSDTSSGISGIGSGMTGFSRDSSLGSRIIQGIHTLLLGAEKFFANLRVNFAVRWGNPDSFDKSLRLWEETAAKKAISEARASSAASKLGYVALILLFLVAVYRGCMWASATSKEDEEIWLSKFRGAIYNFVLALAIQALSKSHPVAIIVGIAVAIMDAVFMYVSDGECDFGYAFDLGLKLWKDQIIPEIMKGYVQYRQIETETQMMMIDKTIEGVVSVGETVSEVVVLGVQEDIKFLKGIKESIGDSWDSYIEWREENKRNSVYDENDLPCWEVPGPSAGL